MGRFNRGGEHPVEKLPPVSASGSGADGAGATVGRAAGRGVAGIGRPRTGRATDLDTLSTPNVRE